MKELIGNTEPVCPHCSTALPKMPARKTKCRACSGDIYVRTRPADRRRVLVTAEGAQRIEEEWGFRLPAPRPQMPSAEEFSREQAVLTVRFGRTASPSDVYWSLANKHLLAHASRKAWGLYRNTRFDMAELLREEGRDLEALHTYMEVAYLDTNGPQNVAAPEWPSFVPFDAPPAPFVIEAVFKLSRQLELNREMVKATYLRVAARQHQELQLPVLPMDAFEQLQAVLSKLGPLGPTTSSPSLVRFSFVCCTATTEVLAFQPERSVHV